MLSLTNNASIVNPIINGLSLSAVLLRFSNPHLLLIGFRFCDARALPLKQLINYEINYIMAERSSLDKQFAL
jgi:hypothetical protein